MLSKLDILHALIAISQVAHSAGRTRYYVYLYFISPCAFTLRTPYTPLPRVVFHYYGVLLGSDWDLDVSTRKIWLVILVLSPWKRRTIHANLMHQLFVNLPFSAGMCKFRDILSWYQKHALYIFALLSVGPRLLALTTPSWQVTATSLPVREYNLNRVRISPGINVNSAYPPMNHCSTRRCSRANNLHRE